MTHLAIQANETLKELLEFEDSLDSFVSNMTSPHDSLYTALEFSKIFHYIAAIFGVIGNLLVIIIYLRSARIRTVTNTYILNVAISDLVYVVTVPVFLISLWSTSWPFGELVCKLLLAKGAIHRFASSLFLLVLIVDTYLSILKPNLSHLCYKHPMSTRLICGLTWLVCVLSVSPVFYHASTFAVPNSDINHCDLMWHGPSREGYIWFTIVFAFVLPTLVKVLLAVPLIYTLAGGNGSEGGSASEGQYQVFAERNKRSAHLILTVIMFHILCWLPLWISLISVNLLPSNEMPDNSAILFHMISGCLGISCTVLSPLIYFKLSPEFRNGLHELMQSCSYYYCAKSQIFASGGGANGGGSGIGINGKSASAPGGGSITADDAFVNNFFPSNVFQQYDEERGQQQTAARQTVSTGQQANGQQQQSHPNRQTMA